MSRWWWLAAVVAAAVGTGALWESSYPGAAHDPWFELIVVLAWYALALGLVAWFVVVAVVARWRTRRRVALGLVIAVLLAVAVLDGITGMALETRFAFSRDALSDVARNPQSWSTAPRRVGLYTVRSVEEAADGSVRLTTHECGLLDPDTCGFAYSPTPVASRCEDYGGVEYEQLSDTWYAFRVIAFCPSQE